MSEEAFYKFKPSDGSGSRLVPADMCVVGVFVTGVTATMTVAIPGSNLEWRVDDITLVGGSTSLRMNLAELVREYAALKVKYANNEA